ncbi:enoyl-CoA hydratase/isomerase family protein [Sulfitobacter pseudonitzschiae]|uniref:Enoyl-CoA hydratase/isomerase family protein n=1 Tax=Pseudosulfitobacter pseudonitzschiae TaxID=1402135 RepID=A0A9Q2RTI9_9RHOB|nr:enoyl-CoA hydratase-related protein [Pseudosulfitobacter pseudonitzschiae]MBM2291113.1 enoyl-CoA hydratase/isomerase family protein [Pseudosulfitobacter pseudonitzschiae]MBM2296031.1 enoyl-CoA hydratase/isomerase family protein [Pseudosulfitobacter pseudonitzschiae]MBM2300944.1 enoyl-CoA hydratase/isomerase family protein [Pseudosulfitobacter pseudonitzschiae]MBM2310728.1 enoyl-CoA hydratase/isomerase family protein [Pseudosulfitobacter pseudonitzschiae]MBM2315641.1 enoyl-CoA hydratase/isom
MNQMQTPDLVTCDVTDGVATLALGGGVAHALSLAMITGLHQMLDDLATEDAARVVVITGLGHIFCAGHDLKEIARHRADDDQGRAYLTELFEACAAMMTTLATFPKPTIAMVDGIATAAGLQLVASCDLAFASPRATACLPGVTNGGFCTTPAVAVSRNVGPKHLMELTLTGTQMTADWALAAGLFNRIFPAGTLDAETRSFATTLATRNPGPISTGKAALQAHRDLPLHEAYALATPVMIEHFMDPGRLATEAAKATAKTFKA